MQGTLNSLARQTISRTLAKVGRGVTLSLERTTNCVWLYNRSDFAVFFLSPTTNVVVKLLPAQSACVYRWRRLDDSWKTAERQTPEQVDCILVSFVKGWNGCYKRQSILSCPCWIQVMVAPTSNGNWNSDIKNS